MEQSATIRQLALSEFDINVIITALVALANHEMFDESIRTAAAD